MMVLSAMVAQAALVDRIVAVVEDQVVLQSDIALSDALAPIDPTPVAFWDRGTGEAREVRAAVVRFAAGDIALYRPSDEAVRARLDALNSQFETRREWVAFLGRWGLDEARISRVLRRRMIVEAYLARNVQAPPAEREAWAREAKGLIDELVTRVRVREVPRSP